MKLHDGEPVGGRGLCGTLLLVGTLLSPGPVPAGETELPVHEVPLTPTHRQVPYETVLAEPIRQAVATEEFALFGTHRKLWIQRPGEPLRALGEVASLPDGFDWYQTACVAGDEIAISVGRYEEARRQSELAAPRGAFKRGALPVGVLVVSASPPRARLIPGFKVTGGFPAEAEGTTVESDEQAEPGPVPETLVPNVQSCQWSAGELVVGGYGFLARLDLEAETARIVEYDLEYTVNRGSLLVDGPTLWVSTDHGGLVSGCIEKIEPGARSTWCLLNYPNDVVEPDTILVHEGRILTSSLAGVVEIDEVRKRYVHYPLASDPTRMRVYHLKRIRGEIWGEREDGFVRIDLEQGRFTHYHLRGSEVSNNVWALLPFGGDWFVATEGELVRVAASDVESP